MQLLGMPTHRVPVIHVYRHIIHILGLGEDVKKRKRSPTPRKAKKKNKPERWDFCTNRDFFFCQLFKTWF